MKILIACEYSGKVRDAFSNLGHYALSCDFLPSDSPNGEHYQGDVFDIIDDGWDMMIALENPIGCISSRIRKPDQIIQPWQFGHPESKSTCLWLKNLPLLQPTNVLTKTGKYWDNQTPSGQNNLGPSNDRWKIRSTTYDGIALAMANQWSI